MPTIRITAEQAGISMPANLNTSKTAEELKGVLPVEGSAQVWGDEIYFSVPVSMPEDDAQAEVPSGTIAYWPPGNAFCIFFGQTPYSPVNVLGQMEGDAKEFGRVEPGEIVRVELVQD